MFLKCSVFVMACLVATLSIADSKDCDNCNRLAEVSYLACFKKAKTDADKKECDSDRDKQKKLCQVTKCSRLPF